MGDFEDLLGLSRANEVEVKVEMKSRDARQLAGSKGRMNV
jgi:hypothetical protein